MSNLILTHDDPYLTQFLSPKANTVPTYPVDTGHSLTALFDDYRLALTDMIFHPVWDTTYGADAAYWGPKLRCLLAAYQDWACADLLAL